MMVAIPTPAHADETTPETTFTIAQVPDTQNEVLRQDDPLMPDRYQWLVNNKAALNLKYIAHTGDVVNWGVVDPVQFTRADAATSILDTSGIPFGYAIGNHDTAAVTVGGGAGPGNVRDNLRNTTAFNQTFPLSRFKDVGGTFESNKVDNIYQTFSAGSVDWLVITHEMWPRQGVIDWMKQVAESHPSHNIIISTHAYTDQNGAFPVNGIYGDRNSQVVWDQFVSQYANIKMVLSGHFGPSVGTGTNYSEKTGVHGNKVAQIMTAYHSNYQNHVRLLKIDTASSTISSSVYVSTSINVAYPTGYTTDAYSNFVTTNMNWVLPEGTGPVDPPPPTAPGAPFGVTATAGDGSATVAFSPPLSNGGSAVTNYTVTSNPGNITASGTGSPITVNGLTNGVSYTFGVTATNAVGTGPLSTLSTGVTPISATGTPELLPDPGFESGNGGWTPFAVGTLTRVTSPVHGGSRALNVAAVSSAVNLVGITQTSVIPNSVAGKTYTAQCYVRPTATGRNAVIRLLEYTQNYSSNIKMGTTTVNNLPANTWTLVKVSGTATAAGKRIIPQVYATNQTTGTGTIAYDDCSVTTETLSGPPTAPAITGVTPGDEKATVSFNAPASDGGSPITQYTVTSQPDNRTASGTGSPIVVPGLTNGVAYRFVVTATNDLGEGPASVASASVTPAPPAPPATAPGSPTNLIATAGNGQVGLNWNAPLSNGGAPITDYTIWLSTSDPDIWVPVTEGVSTQTSAVVSGLTSGTSYRFAVRAVNSVGESEASVPSTSVTPAPPATAPGSPTNLIATAGNGQVGLNWNAPLSNGGAPITDYTIRLSTSNPDNWVPVTEGVSTQTSAVVSGLTNGTSYRFEVRAVNSVGESEASVPSTSVTPAAPPGTPELLSDPGFESGNGGWTPFAVGTLTRVTSPVHGGSRALNVAAVSSAVNLVGITQTSVITSSVAARTYTAQCYVRPTATGRNAVIRFLEYTQNYSSNIKIGTTTVNNLPANTWTLVKVSGTATAAGKRIIPQVYATNQTTNTGTIAYDDCSVTTN